MVETLTALAVCTMYMTQEKDGGQRSQDTLAGTLGRESGHWDTGRRGRGSRDMPGDTCGLLQGHTSWLPECHTPTCGGFK